MKHGTGYLWLIVILAVIIVLILITLYLPVFNIVNVIR